MLIEAMAALAVIALVMAMGFRAIGESAARVRDGQRGGPRPADRPHAAVERGRRHPARRGDTEGRDGDFDWRVPVEPDASATSAAGALWRARVTSGRAACAGRASTAFASAREHERLMSRRDGGFTLIEMLVSLVVLAHGWRC